LKTTILLQMGRRVWRFPDSPTMPPSSFLETSSRTTASGWAAQGWVS